MAVRAEQSPESASTPLTLRAVSVLLICSLGAGTAFAADASLPTEPLHVVKLITEQARLGLAQSSDQRVAVLLDIAEARLTEATELVAVSRDAEADAAVSAYAERVAEAAAQVQVVAATEPAAAEQFRSAVRKQQAAIPAAQGETSAVAIAAELRPTLARENQAQPHEIAAAAANVADRAAASVEQKVIPTATTEDPVASPIVVSRPATPVTSQPATKAAAAASSATTPSTAAASPATPATPSAPTTSSAPSTTSLPDAQIPPVDTSNGKKPDTDDAKRTQAAAKAARESADRAKQAAEQAKQSAAKARDKGK